MQPEVWAMLQAELHKYDQMAEAIAQEKEVPVNIALLWSYTFQHAVTFSYMSAWRVRGGER